MRQDGLPARIHALPPNALVDERPAARAHSWRLVFVVGLACLLVGAALALLWARHEWKAATKPGIERLR